MRIKDERTSYEFHVKLVALTKGGGVRGHVASQRQAEEEVQHHRREESAARGLVRGGVRANHEHAH